MMISKVEPGESEYQDINDGHYQHLRAEQQLQMDDRGKYKRKMDPMRTVASSAEGDRCCTRPPWWVGLLVLLCLLIVAGVAAVLVFLLQSPPKANTSETPNAGMVRGANCQALYAAGYTTSGVHTISPDGVRHMAVYCQQHLDGGGWTVFQRRLNGQVDFNRRWSEYRSGFGDVAGEHWLGNDNIHALTAAGNQQLKIEMTHPDGTRAYADFLVFWIENEMNKYRLHISGFIPRNPPGDALSSHDGVGFTTLDSDNDLKTDANCAQYHYGGWWFTDCHPSHLNGVYNATQWDGIMWYPWTSGNQSLVTVSMMVRTA